MPANTFSSLKVPVIIAVGSVDGVLTSVAVLRLIERDCPILFTQAFQVDQIDVSHLPRESEVILVDLAVNVKSPQMTVDFLRRLRGAGHHLVAIIDEHGRDAWFGARADAGLDDGPLLVEPQGADRNLWPSSGSVLRAALCDGAAPVADLLAAADAADRGDFSPMLASFVNEATKSAITDNSRRVAIARHLAGFDDHTIDAIRGWIEEYRLIEAGNAQALSTLTVEGGIGRIDATRLRIDVTAVLMAAYSRARVVELSTTQGVSFGTGDRALDLLAIAKAAGISAGGFASKINVSHADADRAREAIVVAIGG